MMAMLDYVVIGLLALLVLVHFGLISENRKLKKANSVLNEVLETKNRTIANLEASRVAVKEVIENFSISDKVIAGIEAGESREALSERLGIPVSRIELIVKFDKIKKEKVTNSEE
ncbi:sigma-70 family RNA polymerase sigma factor [Sulfurovum sp.]|jgi:cell division protein FtsB|uniref:sigma-70 family RNA polymerase sigma factor n=1 Tax=Sulfurovum sp. TaxID=1969726 RepID=UPI002A360A15|nr:sigma-70 family RNA polymerase sigma factor [Sulfurovum sp.]MDD2450542.1 sigma-70 family RNA polymerase sigma factor [Sulfurovum sp.]MDD3499357.1 sigma-70 family RNA polymerase sigma factor [Sulfurovum sp.]MDY0403804.1 sigma-70 family RNA polymerase sigma factor [Sulfurovum sp.]